MPDLSDLMKDSVGPVPEFDPASLVARGRHQRQLQLAGVASTVVVIAMVLLVWRNASGDGFVISTRRPSSSTPRSSGASSTATADSSTSSSAPSTTTTLPFTPTSTDPGPTTSTTTTSGASTDPTAADFNGGLGVAATTVHVGEKLGVDWSILNISDHAIEPFDFLRSDASPNPHALAAICVKLTPDGQPEGHLSIEDQRNLFVPPSITRLEPGDGLTWSSVYEPTVDDIGTVTCEVAILDGTRGNLDLDITARVGAIPAVTITVLAAEDVTPTTTGTTTTTLP